MVCCDGVYDAWSYDKIGGCGGCCECGGEVVYEGFRYGGCYDVDCAGVR